MAILTSTSAMNWQAKVVTLTLAAMLAKVAVAPETKKIPEPVAAALTDLMTEADYDLLTDTFRNCAREADGVVKEIYLKQEEKEKADKAEKDKKKDADKDKGKPAEQLRIEKEKADEKAAKKLKKQRFDVSFCYSCKWLMRTLTNFMGEETKTKLGCKKFDTCWEAALKNEKDNRVAEAKRRFIQKYDIDDTNNPKAMLIALNCHMEKDLKAERIISAVEGAVLRKVYATCAIQVTPPPTTLPEEEIPPPDFGKSFTEMIEKARTEDGKPLKDDEKKEVEKKVERAKKNQAYGALVQQLAREDRYKDLQECRKCSQNDWFKRSTDKKEAERKVCVDLADCFKAGVVALDDNYAPLKKKFNAYYDAVYEEVEFKHLHKVVHCQVADAVSTAQNKVPDEIKDELVKAYKACAVDLSNKSAHNGRAGSFQLEELVDDYGTCSPCSLGKSFRKLIGMLFSRSEEKCDALAACFRGKLPEIKDKFPELKSDKKYVDPKGEEILRMRVHCEFFERRYDERQIQEEDRPVLKEIFKGCMKEANDEGLLKRCFPCTFREKMHTSILQLKAAIKKGLDWQSLTAGKEIDEAYTSKDANYECEAVWENCFLKELRPHTKRFNDENDLEKLSVEERALYFAALRVDWLTDTDDPSPVMKLAGELKCAVDDEEKVKNRVTFEERLQLARIMHNCQTNTLLSEMASLDDANPNVKSSGGREISPVPDAKFADLKSPVDAAMVEEAKKLDPKVQPPYDAKHPHPLVTDAEKETAEERDGFRQITKCYTCNDAKFYQIDKHWAKFRRWYKYHGACGEMRKCFRDRIRKKEANIDATLSDKIDKYFKTDDSLDYLMRAVNCPHSATGVTEAYKSKPEKANELFKKLFGKLESYVLGMANDHWKKCIERVIEQKPDITLFGFFCDDDNQIDFRTCMDTMGDRKNVVQIFFSKIVSKIMVWVRDKTICWQYKAATARWKRHLEQNPAAARWKRSPDHSPKMKTLIQITVVIVICGIVASMIVPGTMLLTGHLAIGAPAVGTQVKVGCAAWSLITSSYTDSKGHLHTSTTRVCTQAIYHTLQTAAECAAWAADQTRTAGILLEVFGSFAAVVGGWLAAVFLR